MESTSNDLRTQVPETRLQGVAPDACLKGAPCAGDISAASLTQEVETLKSQLARDQDVTAAGLGVLAEAERRKGRPLTDEERRRTLEKLKVAARDLVEENDPGAEAALRSMQAGDPASAEKRFADMLAQEERAASAAVERAAERRQGCPQSCIPGAPHQRREGGRVLQESIRSRPDGPRNLARLCVCRAQRGSHQRVQVGLRASGRSGTRY